MIGDVLKRRIKELKTSSTNPRAKDAFWVILRDIAKEEIIELYPYGVDSDTIIPIYYDIVSNNLEHIPEEVTRVLPSNGQESYRVTIRNLFSSNAFHPDGLANQEGITAKKIINESKKGYRIVYKGDISNVSKRAVNKN